MNTADFLMLQDRPSSYFRFIPPEPWEQLDAAATVAGFYGQVTRSYTLGIGPGLHITGVRTYNEAAFVGIDQALAAARKYGIRVIIPLINNHKGNDSSKDYFYGDYGQFAELRGKLPSQFWTDDTLIDDFKHLISYLLNRVNTVSNIA